MTLVLNAVHIGDEVLAFTHLYSWVCFFFRHEKLRISIFFPTNQDFHGFFQGPQGFEMGEAFKALMNL